MSVKITGKAADIDIEIEQGANFNPVLEYVDDDDNPIDLTGYSARMHIREEIDDTETLLEITTDNGFIVLGGAAGTITFAVPADDTAALDFEKGVYDLELIDGDGVVTRLAQGCATLNKEVTR